MGLLSSSSKSRSSDNKVTTSANTAQYNDGDALNVSGFSLRGKEQNVNLSLTDQGSVTSAFDFARDALSAVGGALDFSKSFGVAAMQGASDSVSQSIKGAQLLRDSNTASESRNQLLIIMALATVAGVALMRVKK